MDAMSGYNQIKVNKKSCHKLAFAGPNCSEYTYNVMPFGSVNGTVIFIDFIHDLDSIWKTLAYSRNMIIDDTQGTKIIVHNILSWVKTFKDLFQYLTCQLDVCLLPNMSLSLKQRFFCPDHMEFVGHDVCQNGNHPAMSKRALMEH